MKFKTIKQALEYVGKFTSTTKMPCESYDLPAEECVTGSKLRKIKDSVCASCYALKGNYVRYAKTIKPLQYKRLESVDKPFWVQAFVFILNKRKMPFWRWHSSGDIKSVSHFAKICEIARLTPDTLHWQPTREYSFVNQYVANGGVIPDNLIVRFSAYNIGQVLSEKVLDRWGVQSSSVGAENAGFDCVAYKQGGKCLDCRACWTKSITNINYPQH